ncbi:MAG: HtaA domain-containing protein, partial [Actinomycetota bacterium]|nr:HtaA domain-containing protein [Actinomycetota bacterium]
ECGVEATSWVDGNLPPAAALPTLTGEVQAIESPVTWGIKASLRSYLSAPFGRLFADNGATANPSGAPFPAISGWTFPAAAGEYTPGSSATFEDDKAIINGSGSAVFCHSGQFRVVLSNPTIVLDGTNSRIIADVDLNNKGVWTTTQRIDFATIDVNGLEPEAAEAGSRLTWTDAPVALTESGSVALGLCDAAPGAPEGPCAYDPGVALDPITFSIGTENPVAMCSVAQPGGFVPQPAPTAIPATVTPTLASPVDTTGGELEWGFRRSFRGTITSNGHFGLANGALQSDAAMNEDLPAPEDKTEKFFTWPSVTGNYENIAAGDDRLVLSSNAIVSFCNPTHGYGAVIANPTVVIDGADSFISADVSVRQNQEWADGRVDVVKFDLAGVDPTVAVGPTETELEWVVDTVTPAGPGGSPSPLLSAIGAGHSSPTSTFDWLTIKATVLND